LFSTNWQSPVRQKLPLNGQRKKERKKERKKDRMRIRKKLIFPGSKQHAVEGVKVSIIVGLFLFSL